MGSDWSATYLRDGAGGWVLVVSAYKEKTVVFQVGVVSAYL
jgi:hypothetical protein